MGIKTLSAIARSSKQKKNTLKDCDAGSLFGIDIANLLYAGATVLEGVHEFHTKPQQPMQSVLKRVQKMTALFRKFCLKQVWVFDGAAHPMKGGTHEKRWKIPQQALADVKRIMQERDPTAVDALLKAKKKSARPTPEAMALIIQWASEQDDIDVVGAPYEADHLLAWLEMSKQTQGTVTLDSDLFALNCETLIDNLSIHTTNGKCNIWNRTEVIEKLDQHFKFQGALTAQATTTDIVLYLCTLLDTDYTQTSFGMGPVSAGKYAVQMAQDLTKVQDVLNSIESQFNGATGYSDKFWMNVHNFKHAPILVKDVATQVVYLRPLEPLPCGVGPNTCKLTNGEQRKFEAEWERLLTWDPYKHFNLERENLGDFYELKKWSKTKQKLNLVRGVKAGDSEHDGRDTDMPPGSIVDFDHCCVEHQPDFVLVKFLNWRGFKMPQTKNSRIQLNGTVHKVLTNIKNGIVVPILPTQAFTGTHTYVSFEQLRVKAGTTMLWKKEGIALFACTHIPKIDEEYILLIFGTRPGVRLRATLRVNSGNFDIKTLLIAEATLNGDIDATIIRCKCTPSMKANVYDVSLVFKKHDNGWIFDRQSSLCDCPNGCFFCSHMLGLMLVLYILQKGGRNEDQLKALLPPPVKSLCQQGLPAKLVYNRDKFKQESQIKNQVKKEQKEQKKEEEDVESEQEEEEEGVEGSDVANTILKDIGKHFPGYTAAYDDQEDEVVEEEAEAEVQDESKKLFNVCEAIDFYIGQYNARQETAEGEDGREHTIEKIEAYIKELVHGEMDHEIYKNKMIRHELMFRAFRDEKISNDCSMYTFLFFFENIRKDWLENNNEWENVNTTYETIDYASDSSDW